MIASHKVDLLWKCNFEREKQGDDFGLVFAPINIISHENELFVDAAKLRLLQNGDQVIVLSMDVTDYHDFTIDSYEIWFFP